MGLRPDAGGSVSSFTAFGREVFRTGASGAAGAGDLSCFPMVPFVNRIAGGRFVFREKRIAIASTWAPHALHGFGWLRPWDVIHRSVNAAVLSYEADRGSWPWRYRAEQSVVLEGDTARIELAVENRDDRAMPASLGLHPFFAGLDEAELEAHAEGAWLTDEELIPTRWTPMRSAPAAFAPPRRVAGTRLDNCFTGFDGFARITWPGRRIEVLIEAPACAFLQVYSRGADGSFCIEAQTAMPDAFNHDGDTGLRIVEPGERFACVTRFIASQF
jgi:aldose 1-epimerase